MGFFLGLCYFLLAVISLLLVGLILIQDSKAGGLTAAFAGSGDSLVGAAANKEITKFTAVLAAVFIVLCVLVGVLRQSASGTSVVQENTTQSSVSVGVPGAGEGTQGTTPPGGAATPGGDGAGTTPPKPGAEAAPGGEGNATQPPATGDATPPATTGDGQPAGDGG